MPGESISSVPSSLGIIQQRLCCCCSSHGKREKDVRSISCPSQISLPASLLQALQAESSPLLFLFSSLCTNPFLPLFLTKAKTNKQEVARRDDSWVTAVLPSPLQSSRGWEAALRAPLAALRARLSVPFRYKEMRFFQSILSLKKEKGKKKTL